MRSLLLLLQLRHRAAAVAGVQIVDDAAQEHGGNQGEHPQLSEQACKTTDGGGGGRGVSGWYKRQGFKKII